MGWQTKNKAVLIDGTRLIVPLYSDGFSFSLMAITDDGGQTWQFSDPLVGAGNIQPSIARKADGTLVAYMRDNGPPPQRLHVSVSTDKGLTWSTVKDSDLPNPGSGADIVTLRNGHWILAYNDTEKGRHSLAVSLSTDEGKTWSHTRHLVHSDSEEGAPDSRLSLDHPGRRRQPPRRVQLSEPGGQDHQARTLHRGLVAGEIAASAGRRGDACVARTWKITPYGVTTNKNRPTCW